MRHWLKLGALTALVAALTLGVAGTATAAQVGPVDGAEQDNNTEGEDEGIGDLTGIGDVVEDLPIVGDIAGELPVVGDIIGGDSVVPGVSVDANSSPQGGVDLDADVNLPNAGNIDLDADVDTSQGLPDADADLATDFELIDDVVETDDNTTLGVLDLGEVLGLVSDTTLRADLADLDGSLFDDNVLLDEDVVVLQLCHTSDLTSATLGLLDVAGNTVDLVTGAQANSDVFIAVNSNQRCDGSSAGAAADNGGGLGNVVDGDVFVAQVCHQSVGGGVEGALADLAGNVLGAQVDELGTNDVMVAVNSDRPCRGDSGSDGGEGDGRLLADDLVVGVICHRSGVGASSIGVLDALGNPIGLEIGALAINDVLVALNSDQDCEDAANGGLGGENDDDGSGDDGLLEIVGDDLITVGICHTSDAFGVVDLAGNQIGVDGWAMDQNDLLVAINTGEPCPGTTAGSYEEGTLGVVVCLASDLTTEATTLTELAGPSIVADATTGLVLALGVDDPCQAAAMPPPDDDEDDGGDDGDDDGDGDGDGDDDSDGGDGGEGGEFDEDEDDGPPFGDSDRDDGSDGVAFAAASERADDDSGFLGLGGPSINTGGFGVISADNPGGTALTLAVGALVAAMVGFVTYRKLHQDTTS
ncbi:MAG: hypothetical protein GEU28_04800 [Dehalococcoidia bacterium]|nr:hypothetical protein [Dehalococcoidia bacterium]